MINHKIFETPELVVENLANEMKAYSEQGKPVHISLSGGSTPKMLFKLLAHTPYAEGIQWNNLHFWWGDERCVAPDDAESNYGEANALLFSQVNLPADTIHDRMKTRHLHFRVCREIVHGDFPSLQKYISCPYKTL